MWIQKSVDGAGEADDCRRQTHLGKCSLVSNRGDKLLISKPWGSLSPRRGGPETGLHNPHSLWGETQLHFYPWAGGPRVSSDGWELKGHSLCLHKNFSSTLAPAISLALSSALRLDPRMRMHGAKCPSVDRDQESKQK